MSVCVCLSVSHQSDIKLQQSQQDIHHFVFVSHTMDVGRVLTATERYLEKLRAKADSDRQTFKVAVVGTGVLLCAAGAYVLIKSKKNKDQSTPGLLGLSGGSAGKTKSVKETFKEFTQAYETAGEGIQDQVRSLCQDFLSDFS